ncbi:MAG: pitrilysin family protein [Pseudomonadota bacterium]
MTLLMRTIAVSFLFLWTLPAYAVDIREETSPGGITFWMVEEPTIPIVSVQISFDGGSRLDPEGKEGLTTLTVGLIDDGSGELDAVGFANARDDLAARFGFGAGRDAVSVSAQMLVETMEPAARLLATAIAVPSFDPEALERSRGRLLSGLAQQETDPNAIARKAWNAAAFPYHPYGRTATPESVSSITREDMIAALPRLINRANATVAIVGAITPDQAGDLIDTILGGITEGEPTERTWTELRATPGIAIFDTDVPQSTAIFGHSGIKRTDPDFIPAFVMNYTLGGGSFNSRLTEEVRERRGLAYSVYSYMSVRAESAGYLGSVQTANEGMAESIEVIRSEWERMAAEGITEEELEKAKKYLTGAFALRFDSNAKIANYLVFMQDQNLGIDYLDRRNGLIEAVTLEDVRRVAARVLRPDGLMITIAGRPEGIEATR